jgi:hypothetical protein
LGLSYAGINRGQVQRVSLSLLFLRYARKKGSTPSLYGCGTKLKDNATDCKPSQHHDLNKRFIKQMVLVKWSSGSLGAAKLNNQ